MRTYVTKSDGEIAIHGGSLAAIVEGGALEIREMRESGDYRVVRGYGAGAWSEFRNEVDDG